MKDFNIVKVDSKGRILIPFHIRNYIELNENSEVMFVENGKKELKIIPILPGENATVTAVIKDQPGSLAKLLDIVSNNNIDIIASRSKTLDAHKNAEWSAMLDVTSCKDIKKFQQELSRLDTVEKVEVDAK